MEELEKFLSNRVDSRRVTFAKAVLGYSQSDIDFWAGDYFLKFTVDILPSAKDIYTPKKFDREI